MQENQPDLQTEESTGPVPSIPAPLPSPIWSALVLVAFCLGLGAGYLIWAAPQAARASAAEARASAAEKEVDAIQQAVTAAAVEQPPAAQPPAGEQQVQRYDVPEDDDPSWGNPDAPITIIEFSDYECPYCQRWHNEAWPQIQAKYGDKVRLVFRDFPLTSIHPNAVPAAEAANCAGEQDRYFEFNTLLFSGSQPLGPAAYEAYAQQVGLKMQDFQACVAERRYQEEVEADLNYAGQLGVRSTPTFFINGLAVIGAQPFEVFDEIIGLELQGKIPR